MKLHELTDLRGKEDRAHKGSKEESIVEYFIREEEEETELYYVEELKGDGEGSSEYFEEYSKVERREAILIE